VWALYDMAAAIARDYSAKRVSIVAAALAYYLFLALFPFLLVLIAAFGYLLGSSERTLHAVRETLSTALPASGLHIERQLSVLIAHRAVVGGFGLLGLAWSASNAFAIFAQTLQIVWGVRPRTKFVLSRLRALAFLALAVIFLLASTVITSAIPVLTHVTAAGVARRLAEIRVLWRFASAAVSLALGFVIFLALYRIVPAAHIKLRHAAAGAAFAAIAWELAKGVFAWYLGRFGNFDRVYGPVAAIVALLLWIYVSVIIVLVGAELASVSARQEGGAASGR
jgi:membrane protein